MADFENLKIAKREERYGLMFPEFPWHEEPSMFYDSEEEALKAALSIPHPSCIFKQTVLTTEWEPV